MAKKIRTRSKLMPLVRTAPKAQTVKNPQTLIVALVPTDGEEFSELQTLVFIEPTIGVLSGKVGYRPLPTDDVFKTLQREIGRIKPVNVITDEPYLVTLLHQTFPNLPVTLESPCEAVETHKVQLKKESRQSDRDRALSSPVCVVTHAPEIASSMVALAGRGPWFEFFEDEFIEVTYLEFDMAFKIFSFVNFEDTVGVVAYRTEADAQAALQANESGELIPVEQLAVIMYPKDTVPRDVVKAFQERKFTHPNMFPVASYVPANADDPLAVENREHALALAAGLEALIMLLEMEMPEGAEDEDVEMEFEIETSYGTAVISPNIRSEFGELEDQLSRIADDGLFDFLFEDDTEETMESFSVDEMTRAATAARFPLDMTELAPQTRALVIQASREELDEVMDHIKAATFISPSNIAMDGQTILTLHSEEQLCGVLGPVPEDIVSEFVVSTVDSKGWVMFFEASDADKKPNPANCRVMMQLTLADDPHLENEEFDDDLANQDFVDDSVEDPNL